MTSAKSIGGMMRAVWQKWQLVEGGSLVPAKGTHPYYNLARYGWKTGMRVAELQRHPICTLCQRKASEMVDHIIPFISPEGIVSWALFSNPANHRALCRPCHSMLTAKYDGGFSNPRRTGKESHVMPTGESGKQFTSSSISVQKLDAALDFDPEELLKDLPE
jgi:hypothetical protein